MKIDLTEKEYRTLVETLEPAMGCFTPMPRKNAKKP